MREQHTPPVLALSVSGAAQACSLSQSAIDIALREGILPARRYGNKTLILITDLEQWLHSLPEGRAAAPAQFLGRRPGRPRKFPKEEKQ